MTKKRKSESVSGWIRVGFGGRSVTRKALESVGAAFIEDKEFFASQFTIEGADKAKMRDVVRTLKRRCDFVALLREA